MDDAALMARLAAGDASAIGDLYDGYGRQVYALAFRMLEDAAAAEDITQEVFVKVWRSATRYDPERGSAATWILHLAYTATADLLRARRRASPCRYEACPDERDLLADTAADAETTVMGAQVRGALMRLPAEQRQAVEMAYYGAMTQTEIAQLLAIPLGTVKSRIRLGLEALRRALMAGLRKDRRDRKEAKHRA